MTAKKITTKKNTSKKAATKRPSVGLHRTDIIVAAIAFGLIGFGVWHNISNADTVRNSAVSDTCAQVGREHQITVNDDLFTPTDITVNRCDRIIIANHGQQTYDLMIGETMQSHVAYPGFDGQLLKSGEYFVFDAFKAGSYPLADHSRNLAKLQITINE